MKDNTIIDETEVSNLFSWAIHVQEVEHFINNEGNNYFFKEGVQIDFDTIYQRQYEKFEQNDAGHSDDLFREFKESEIRDLQTWIKNIEEIEVSPIEPDTSTPFFLRKKHAYNFKTSMVYLLSIKFIEYLISKQETQTEEKSLIQIVEYPSHFNNKRINIRWYAFYYCILIEMKLKYPIPTLTTAKGMYDQKEIIKRGFDEFGLLVGTGYGFYDEYKKIDKLKLPSYCEGVKKIDSDWKNILFHISGNNKKIKFWIDENL